MRTKGLSENIGGNEAMCGHENMRAGGHGGPYGDHRSHEALRAMRPNGVMGAMSPNGVMGAMRTKGP